METAAQVPPAVATTTTTTTATTFHDPQDATNNMKYPRNDDDDNNNNKMETATTAEGEIPLDLQSTTSSFYHPTYLSKSVEIEFDSSDNQSFNCTSPLTLPPPHNINHNNHHNQMATTAPPLPSTIAPSPPTTTTEGKATVVASNDDNDDDASRRNYEQLLQQQDGGGGNDEMETDNNDNGDNNNRMDLVSQDEAQEVPQQALAVGGGEYSLTGRLPMCIALSCDYDNLSEYQCLLRKQIELFEAHPIDVEATTQGRNKAIVLGQAGIRCLHCACIPPMQRTKAAMYYPAKLESVYQAGQNMAASHFLQGCQHIPAETRTKLMQLRDDGKSSAGGGKKFWADSIQALGVVEDQCGLRLVAHWR